MIHQIFAAGLLAQGILFGAIAYVMYRRKSARLARFEKNSGEVIEVKEHSAAEGDPTRHPVIRYTAFNGETLTFESKFGSSNWKVKPGDRLDVLVSRDNPADAEIFGFFPQWAIPLFLGIASAGSILSAPIVYLLLKP